MQMEIVTLDPTYEQRARAEKVATALPSLKGISIGLLDNNKKNVGHFLRYVGDELKERYGVGELVHRRKANMSAPAPEEVVRDLAQCEAVVVAIGD